MKPRSHIERAILIVLLCVGYARQARGLSHQGAIGIPALIVGAVIMAWIITGLVKRSSGMALALGLIGLLSAVAQPLFFFLSKSSGSSYFDLALSEGFVMVGAYCYIDLWSEWKKPNHFPQPPLRAAD
jgi:hypothetical protein